MYVVMGIDLDSMRHEIQGAPTLVRAGTYPTLDRTHIGAVDYLCFGEDARRGAQVAT
jgi:hypothetical protein